MFRTWHRKGMSRQTSLSAPRGRPGAPRRGRPPPLFLEKLEDLTLPSVTWNIVPSPNPDGTRYDPLNGVAAVSESDVWAVGTAGLQGGPGYQTLTEHWGGSGWGIVESPNTGGNFDILNGVEAVAPDDVWAVGHSFNGGTGQTLIEHWDGQGWSIIPSPSPGAAVNQLDAVTAVSPNDVWAVGGQRGSWLGCHPLM